MDNDPDILILELAGGFLGTAAVPLDSKRDTPDRKIFKLKQTGARLLFTKSGGRDEIEVKKNLPELEIVRLDDSPLETLLEYEPEMSYAQLNGSLETDYLILYTSGTTLYPKGVPLSIAACMANADGIVRWQQLSPADRFLLILPLHHINSTIFYLATLLAGGTIILSSRYSVSKFWETVSSQKATITSVVPTVLHDLLSRKDEYFSKDYDISSMRRILIGSAPVLPEETLRFRETFQVDVVQGYGQTETALRVTGVPIDLDTETYLDMVRKNSIGVALANCDVTILKEGREVDENEEGEICIRGPVLTRGYLDDFEETAKVFTNGWFHSGDLGYYRMIGGSKFFFMKGRVKEIIIKGGVNISPAVVEDALLKSFPEIEEVSVVGYPDARMGEEIAAVIYFKRCSYKRKQDILSEIVTKGKLGSLGISKYEAPQRVFEVQEELPKTSTGKIKRTEIKGMVKDWINQAETRAYHCRLLYPEEDELLLRAVEINNKRWNIVATVSEFKARARNGYLLGVFDENENLCGTLSALQVSEERLSKTATWDWLTGDGTLRTHDENGAILICVAISVDGDVSHFFSSDDGENKDIEAFAESLIEKYLETDLDSAIRFHRKAKGGLAGGKVTRIFPHAREDEDSLGYNVLVEYPEMTEDTTIVPSAHSPSISLVEAAMLLAQEKGCRKVMAFSRPAQFKFYLTKALDGSLFDTPGFSFFSRQVQEKLSEIHGSLINIPNS